MLLFFAIVNTLLLVVVISQRGIKLSRLRRIETIMATKEDVARLEEAQRKTLEAVDLVAADTTALKDELKALNENTNVDLSGVIATAEGMEARLRAIAGPNAGSDPETPSEEELPPLPEPGGGEPA